MKKSLGLLLGGVMVMSMPLTVLAKSIDNAGGFETVPVELELQNGYMVTIPESIDFQGEAETTADVEISVERIGKNESLKVFMTSQQGWTLQEIGHEVTNQLQYHAVPAGGDGSGNEIATASMDEKSVSKTINFTIDDFDQAASGSYKDTLTFTVKVESNG